MLFYHQLIVFTSGSALFHVLGDGFLAELFILGGLIMYWVYMFDYNVNKFCKLMVVAFKTVLFSFLLA